MHSSFAYGASAIGFVFWPASPRFVDPYRARAIAGVLPPFVTTVGVFVNQQDEAERMAREAGLTAVQFHGDEAPGTYRAMPLRVMNGACDPDQIVALLPCTSATAHELPIDPCIW